MIKNVIKRDGRVEEFSAEKINSWIQWSEKTVIPKDFNWSTIVLKTISTLPEQVTTKELQEALIRECLNQETWEGSRMAGRLYASALPKELYESRKHPTIKELHVRLYEKGLIIDTSAYFTNEEYDEINKMLVHRRDYTYSHYAIKQLIQKYSMQDRVLKQSYETPQFIYMRVAMQTYMNYQGSDRLSKLKSLYEDLSHQRINVPTPYFSYSLTVKPNTASCSVLTCGDEAESIGVLNTLAYTLTTAGAGVGAHMKTRSLGDGIRNGSIKHAGKVPYYRAFANVMRSSMQASRSGASTMHFPVFDLEVEILMGLKNPLSTLANRVRESDYAISINKPFVKRMVTDKPFWLFSYKDNPELYEEFYHADSNNFDRHLEEFVMQNPEKVTEVKASDLFSNGMNNRLSTGRLYVHFADTANKQTPYKDTIYSSNLCMEISNVTKPFKNHAELYSDTPDGVVGFCNLAGINIPHIKDDEEYEQACYNALMMIESGIENTKFVFPALNANLKDYRSAGVGVVGLAYLMAKKHMSYTTQEGRDFIFEQSEKFAYFVTKAAIKITEELGPCKVMDNNKYAEGWLPMDDASPAALALTTKSLSYDWDAIREDMKRLGGLRFSTLMAHMPAESSSIACSLTNSIYPIRELSLTKTAGDSSNKWIAPEATKLAKWYEIAWNMSNEHHINNYALWQIFNDQSISADLYADRTKTVNIPMSQLFKEIAYSAKLGLKSHYYYNTLTDSKESTEFLETRIEDNTEAELEDFDDSEGCDSGGCTL